MLTARQTEVMDALYQHVVDTGVPPTIRELCDRLGIASPNGIMCHIRSLRSKGAIEADEETNKSRGILPTNLRDCLRAAAKKQAGVYRSLRKAV